MVDASTGFYKIVQKKKIVKKKTKKVDVTGLAALCCAGGKAPWSWDTEPGMTEREETAVELSSCSQIFFLVPL